MMQGYALLCVGFPSSDLEVETQDEDEVIQEKFIHHLSVYYKASGRQYGFQFGRYFVGLLASIWEIFCPRANRKSFLLSSSSYYV